MVFLNAQSTGKNSGSHASFGGEVGPGPQLGDLLHDIGGATVEPGMAFVLNLA